MKVRTAASAAVLSVVGLAVLSLAPGIGAATPDSPAPPRVVTITATDFEFDAPPTLPAGAVTIRLVNEGSVIHHAQLVRLDDGKTPRDLAAAMETGAPLDFATWVGGPGIAAPGMASTATVALRPGDNYYWLCFIESSDDHMPHIAKGMVRRVAVEPGPREPLPEPDNTLMLTDYDFNLGKPLTAGRQVVRVRNTAPQPHEVMLIKLTPGKTLEDVLAWMAAGEQGPPPGIPMGGMQALSQGVAGNLELDLEPGEYGLICFVPDARDGQPHFVHGMAKQITVQ